MKDYPDEVRRAFRSYRTALEEAERKRKPTDGLLGFGRALKDDPCHEVLDREILTIVDEAAISELSAEIAASIVEALLFPESAPPWPLSAQWMLRAEERHALKLIPFVAEGDAADLAGRYASKYRPWDRLPAQKAVLQELKKRGRSSG